MREACQLGGPSESSQTGSAPVFNWPDLPAGRVTVQ